MRFHATETREITPAEIGWCAGFIDGEGCLSLHRQSGRLGIQLRAVNTVREPIDRLREILGGTVRCWRKRLPPRVPAWRWYCPQRELPGVLEALLPHLTVKREQAEAALAYLKLGLVGPREERRLEAALSTGSKRRKAGVCDGLS